MNPVSRYLFNRSLRHLLKLPGHVKTQEDFLALPKREIAVAFYHWLACTGWFILCIMSDPKYAARHFF